MKGKLFITAAALVLGLGCGITASASPRVVSYGFVFDPQFYAETNPDVVASLGLDMEFVETGLEDDNLTQHYVDSGIAEGRVPYFDAVYYAAANPDVAALYGTDAQALYRHYVNYGKAEGRLPYDPNAAAALPAAGPTVRQISGGYTIRHLSIVNDSFGNGWRYIYYRTDPNGQWTQIYGPENGAPLGDFSSPAADGAIYIGFDVYDVYVPSNYFEIRYVDSEGAEGRWYTSRMIPNLNYDPFRKAMFSALSNDWFWVETAGDEVDIRIPYYPASTTIDWYLDKEPIAPQNAMYARANPAG